MCQNYNASNITVLLFSSFSIMQFNFRNFKILQLEKLALFKLAYFCHPSIKPKFPSRQNYPIYGISKVYKDIHLSRLCSARLEAQVQGSPD